MSCETILNGVLKTDDLTADSRNVPTQCFSFQAALGDRLRFASCNAVLEVSLTRCMLTYVAVVVTGVFNEV